METKENYRQWLQSDNAEIRNLAFQAALINKTFSLEELVFGFPELTERNLAWVLKMHPEKLGDFITDVKRLKFIPVKVVTEIVGLLSFYLPLIAVLQRSPVKAFFKGTVKMLNPRC